ncbi:hypothetical protein SAMN02745883_00854 [Caminicella sporogenes DSM 14501]|uniref:PQQ-like domain-containing protein n=1 Tax=Caminicella sporogenes DSM 14501 TaxID=1121266 RepID=A0A1M6NEX2_9FIRM|nr:DUF5711 family protein [Caminicella sporogenes]RKD22224.1 hypothetical protein BET04_06325 [Caminicella sporogenes]SHJ94213.1 hypothetical protein SAMN02745883_00854 [Caminicella sporogenes DSM 14501]
MNKRKRRKKINFLNIIIGLVFIVLIFNKFFPVLKTVLKVGEVSLEKKNSISYINKNDKKGVVEVLNDYIVKIENNTISLFDSEGNDLWQRKLNVQTAVVRQAIDKIIIADCERGEIIYLDYKGNILGNIQINKKIFNLKLNREGYQLITTEENEIYVINNKGEIISNISVPKGEIIDGHLSNDHNMIVLTILNVEENNFYSNVLFYSLEGKIISGKKFSDRIILNLFFDDKAEVLGLGDGEIFKINSEGKLLWTKKIENTLNLGKISNKGSIVLSLIKKRNPIIDTKNRSVISKMSADGNILFTTSVVGDIISIDIKKKNIAAATKRTIYLIDDKGNLILEKKINKDIKNICWISDKFLAVIFKERVEVMKVDY